MFSFVSSQSAAMFKPLGFMAAIQLLNFFGVFSDIYNWFRFFFGQLCGSLYGTFTGMDSNWLFFQGNGVPIQMRYTNSTIRDRAKWYYIERTGQWVHSGCFFGQRANHFPFVLINLNVNGSRYELTDFFANHRYYYPTNRHAVPHPLMLVNAWSIMSHNWFNLDQLENAHFQIMGMDCELHNVPILATEDDLENYYSLFGLTLRDNNADSGSDSEEEESSGSDSEEEGSGSDSEEEGSGSEEEGSGSGSGSDNEEEGIGSEEEGSGSEDSGSEEAPAATSADTETPPLEKVD